MKKSIGESIRFIILILCLCFVACKKEGDTNPKDDDGNTPQANLSNWEVVRSFAREDSYDKVLVEQLNGNAFISTYGFMGIGPGSGGSLSETLKGSFYYKSGNDWYIYRTSNEATIQLKVFNNALYGLKLKQTVKSRLPVLSYNYEYTLCIWENENFKDIAKINHVNQNGISQSDLGEVQLWINQSKIHVVYGNANFTGIYTLNGNQFSSSPISYSFTPKYFFTPDNKDVSFTLIRAIIVNPQRTETTVQGLYFNGQNFNLGKRQVFIEDIGFSNKDAKNYVALNGQLWGLGFQNRHWKNYDSGQTMDGTIAGSLLSGSIMQSQNGKLYTVVEKDGVGGSVTAIGVFDGQNYREIPFKMPSNVDEYARLKSITEQGNSTYMMVLSNFSYVLLKKK